MRINNPMPIMIQKLRGHLMSQENTVNLPVKIFPYHVYYADTDAGGIVYYAQYLRMFEQARTLYVKDCGLTLREMERRNCVFVCRNAEIEYLSPALLDDHLQIHTQITDIGKVYLLFAYTVTSGDRKNPDGKEITIVKGTTKLVACKIQEDHAMPIRIPRWILDAILSETE